MRPSEWPWYAQLLAVALTLGIVIALGWFVRTVIDDWPVTVLVPMAVGMLAFGIGFMLGEASATRVFKRRLGDGAHGPEDAA